MDHFVFASLSDPADVVVVLLPDAISGVGTDVPQDSSSDIICYSKILGIARRAHPAKRAKAQRENVSVLQTEGEQHHCQFSTRRKKLVYFFVSFSSFYSSIAGLKLKKMSHPIMCCT